MYNQSQQNYGYQQQPMMNRPIYQQASIKGRPVSSIEEARASIIDFDGSVFVFPDIANKRIYTKQIGMDGSAIMNVYELKEQAPPPSYITREEFENVVNQLRNALNNNAPKEALELNF